MAHPDLRARWMKHHAVFVLQGAKCCRHRLTRLVEQGSEQLDRWRVTVRDEVFYDGVVQERCNGGRGYGWVRHIGRGPAAPPRVPDRELRHRVL